MKSKVIIGFFLICMAIGSIVFYFLKNNSNLIAAKEVINSVTTTKTESYKCILGSEKYDLMSSAEVISFFEKNGIKMDITKKGTKEIIDIVNSNKQNEYDLLFVSGEISSFLDNKNYAKDMIFTSPMVIASWKTIGNILEKNSIVTKSNNINYVNMEKLLGLINEKKRWKDLKNNSEYDVNKPILITTTDPVKSNSAIQFFTVISYIFNNFETVQNENDLNKVYPKTADMFLRQGYKENTSDGPFNDYINIGIGKVPLVFIYEAQIDSFLQKQPNPNMEILYPVPTAETKHIIYATNTKSKKIIELMKSEEFLLIAMKYGFRTVKSKNKAVIKDVVGAPSLDIINSFVEKMKN